MDVSNICSHITGIGTYRSLVMLVSNKVVVYYSFAPPFSFANNFLSWHRLQSLSSRLSDSMPVTETPHSGHFHFASHLAFIFSPFYLVRAQFTHPNVVWCHTLDTNPFFTIMAPTRAFVGTALGAGWIDLVACG